MSDAKKDDPTFYVTYKVKVHPEGIKQSELAQDESACDAIVMLPVGFPPNGSFSMMIRSKDGRPLEGGPGPMAPNDLWRAWVTMGALIKDDPKLSPAQRLLASKVFDALTAAKNAMTKPQVH
jgi:hypothetical protein